jgi:flagellar hook protein FlgE
MNKVQHISQNATLNSVEMINSISSNIYGYANNGHRAKRFKFSDYASGGQFKSNGYSWAQGKQEPRFGEWTKMMIKGRGLFEVQDPKSRETYYTRLGDFHLDATGFLVSSEGLKVQAIPLAAGVTKLQGPLPGDLSSYKRIDPNLVDPYNNPYTNNRQRLNPAGNPIAASGEVFLGLDPRNGRYLGKFDEIKVGEDGVIYGRDGRNIVSLYRLKVVDFNNLNGLQDIKDGVYYKATDRSGMPIMKTNTDTVVIGEALEKSNSWIKVEAHALTDAQRYFQSASQIHKLADKISGTAIEMIQ